jgi:hypothetical protein
MTKKQKVVAKLKEVLLTTGILVVLMGPMAITQQWGH